ncbi:polymorphic toxin type 44 domain-containing protein [Pedobacter albus]
MGPESIHLDKYGTVLKNVDDGDKSVHVHEKAQTEADVNKTYSTKNTSADGEKIGELGGKINVDKVYANLLEKNMKEAKGIYNPWTFKEKVRNKGDWDLKSDKGSIFGLGNDGKTIFSFQGKSMEAQDIGNHHFGAVGKAYGFFTEEFMLKQAGAAQMAAGTSLPEWQKYLTTTTSTPYGTSTTIKVMLPPYGDDPRDQSWVSI